MPVDTPHPDYTTLAPLRQIVRDVVAGEHTIHAKGTDYLARLSGMTDSEYVSYVNNTDFYPATSRTIQGFLGAAFRVPPVIQVLPSMEEWKQDIDLAGTSLDTFLKKEFEDKLAPGCYGIRIDMREGGSRPYFAPYTCENIINWRFGVLNGRKVLTRIVLRENEYLPTDDEFLDEERDVRLVLDLVDGRCRSRMFRRVDPHSQEWIPTLLDPPNKNSVLLDFIPFVLDGEFDGKPPLLDLASTNLGHYRRTADYVDAMLFSSKPQPYVSGVDPLGKDEKDVLQIGSRYAWRLPMGALPGYLQSSGAGIGEIRQALQDYESRMSRLGAAVIEEPKEGVEAAETARINQSGKASVLSHHVTVTSQAATAALRMAAWWGGATSVRDDLRIMCALNQDFIEARLSPTDLLALIQSWQVRGISRDTLTYNIQRGGLLPEGRTVEEEMELIDNEGPILREGEEEDLDDEDDKDKKETVMEEAA